MENCRTCSHFIPDPKAPRKGMCEAIANGDAVRKMNYAYDPRNPRVRLDGNDCLGEYVIEPRSRFTYNPRTKTKVYVPDIRLPAYEPKSLYSRVRRCFGRTGQ